jgi:hypothetical protein
MLEYQRRRLTAATDSLYMYFIGINDHFQNRSAVGRPARRYYVKLDAAFSTLGG